MLRSRYIKPGIVANEELCALGPFAYILFTGLWMLADREGRLEDRPKRIKALVMPMWDELSAADVEKLLENLSKQQFIQRYEVGGIRYIQITTWKKHQHPNGHETQSKIPPPLSVPLSVNGAAPVTCGDCGENAHACTCMHRNALSALGLELEEKSSGDVEVLRKVAPDSPPPKISTAQRKPPGSERQSRAAVEDQEPAPPPLEDIAALRESLNALAREIRMPPPDDGIIRKILALAGGATVDEIHRTLVMLYRRHKFREIHSWGFIPVVLSDYFVRCDTVATCA